jgi:hypothetical protein
MLSWAASSELLVMLLVLGFLVIELVRTKREIRRDKAKAAKQPPEQPRET